MPARSALPKSPIFRSLPRTILLLLLLLALCYWYLKARPLSGFSLFPSVPPTPTPVSLLTTEEAKQAISLPAPAKTSRFSVESALQNRRSVSNFKDQPVSLKDLSQLLWSGQGVTASWGGRTSPSFKSVYPLTLYLVAGRVDGLGTGVYRYIPGDNAAVHQLLPVNLKEPFIYRYFTGLVNQTPAKEAPAAIIVAGNFSKMTAAMGGKAADHYVYLEAGHTSQNIYLQAESLSLGTVAIGNLDAGRIASYLNLPGPETVLYVLPVGHPKE